MPPTIILIRHAEALHNVNKDYSIPDPPLSELGVSQCSKLRTRLREQVTQGHFGRPELIVTSPMRRTLQTTTLALDWLIDGTDGKGKVPVIPSADWQENSAKPCDTGSPLDTIASEYPRIDLSLVDRIYPNKTTPKDSNPYRFTREGVLARGQRCLASLYNRPEEVVAVVSHSAFLRCGVTRRWYGNADYRIFDIQKDEAGMYGVKEWEETEANGGGMGWSDSGVYELQESDFVVERLDAGFVEQQAQDKV